jgi:hypothetical protein
MLEIQLDEEAAKYMENFWTDIIVGDAILGAGFTTPAALGAAGAGAGGWVWTLGWAWAF